MNNKFIASTGLDDVKPCLRGFDEKAAVESVNGALALRPEIERQYSRPFGKCPEEKRRKALRQLMDARGAVR